jgi:uncharacterized membrane protein YdjX (TVP38/TMEM64 family)
LGAALLWSLRSPVIELLTFVSDRDAFTTYIYGFGWLGPVVLSLLHLVQILISILPGDVFYFAAGYVYGLAPGFALNLIVTVASGLLAFFIARRWGRPVVDRLAPARVIDRWDAAARHHGFVFFVMSFMLPIFPTDTMNYVAGLSLIPWQQFALASLLGRAPMILLFTFLGAHGTDIVALKLDPILWVIVAIVVICLYVVWLIFFRKLTTEALNKGRT